MTFLRLHRTRLASAALVLFLSLILPVAPAAEEEPPLQIEGVPTNLGLADRMARQVADAAVADLDPWLEGEVALKAGRESSGNPLVLLALKDSLRRSGRSPLGAEAVAHSILEYRILDLRIAYTGVDRRALGLKQEVERAGALVLALSALDGTTGEELASVQKEVLLADHFPKHLLDLVASSAYPFTNPELKERDWAKVVEPWVVGGLVLSLAWLFYSNQSSE